MHTRKDIEEYLQVLGRDILRLDVEDLVEVIKNKYYKFMDYEGIRKLSTAITLKGDVYLMGAGITPEDIRDFSEEYRERLIDYIVTEEDIEDVGNLFDLYDRFYGNSLDSYSLESRKENKVTYINHMEEFLGKYRTKLNEGNKKPDDNLLSILDKRIRGEMLDFEGVDLKLLEPYLKDELLEELLSEKKDE